MKSKDRSRQITHKKRQAWCDARRYAEQQFMATKTRMKDLKNWADKERSGQKWIGLHPYQRSLILLNTIYGITYSAGYITTILKTINFVM